MADDLANTVETVLGGEAAGSEQGAAANPLTETNSPQAVAGDQSAAAAVLHDGQSESASTPAAIEYGDFSVPEGMTLNAELLGEFKEVAKGLGLKQEQAQALADLGVKQAQAIVSQFEAQRVAESAAWLAAAKTDKEFGGEKLAENLAVAKRAMDAFATPELKAVLDKTGLGNHPELIRAFVKAGKLISEDSLVPGGTQPVVKGGKSLAERLYPEQGKG